MSQPTSIDWTKIKALTFDIYGTLVDWDAGVVRAARATALGPFLPSDEEFLVAVEDHHARIEREQPRMRKSDINAEGLRAYAADLGVVKEGKLTEEELEEAAKQFGGSIGQFEAFDDTVMLQSFSNEPHRFIELTQAKVNAIQRLSKHFKILVPLTNMDHASYNGTLSVHPLEDTIPINPHASQINLLRRLMVVEQTLRDMADVVLLDTIIGLEVIEQVVEIRKIGLV